MRSIRLCAHVSVAVFAFLLLATPNPAPAQQVSEFSYQGQIENASQPADGNFDFEFELFDQAADGTSVAGPLSRDSVEVTDGLFSVTLDFGSAVFDGQPLWLEIRVRESGSGASHENLSPRQSVLATPYAIKAIESQSSGSVAYLDVTNRPAGLDDGDDDTLGELSCEPDEVPRQIGGDWTCSPSPLVEQSAQGACLRRDGQSGIVVDKVCLLDYGRATEWNTAAATCVARGGDLCSPSQYEAIRLTDEPRQDLFYSNDPVWSKDFSDNDLGSKSPPLYSSDDPAINQLYGYACCGNATPQPARSAAMMVNGVMVTHVRTSDDTTWSAAARLCHALNSDLCSKSQYVALNDAGEFNAVVARATYELSDNDGGLLDSVVGSTTPDNPSRSSLFAFACCGNTRTSNAECLPGDTALANGLCVAAIHDTEDTNFFDAARACTALEADVCSNSQMQALRNVGQFFGESWTNDGADNDSVRVGGLLGSQPDNPDPATDLFGYACCR